MLKKFTYNGEGHTVVAQWETTGHRWIVLYKWTTNQLGTRTGSFTLYDYTVFVRNNYTGGGSLNCTISNDKEAIAKMEQEAGPVYICKLDHPSLTRVI